MGPADADVVQAAVEAQADALGRPPEPEVEIRSLADYDVALAADGGVA